MIIALLGASCSGKSLIQEILSKEYGYEKIISYTTRAPRGKERNGVDYFFISDSIFKRMIESDIFAEHDSYSQNRLYGTARSDYNTNKDKVVVLTPNGLRQLKRNCPNEKIFSVLVEASLGTRIKRYIDRCNVENFNFDDKNEISARVERDYGMFLGLEREVDMVIYNSENADIDELVDEVIVNVSGL